MNNGHTSKTNNTINNTSKKENKTMTRRDQRMETLENAGISTGKFFNVNLPQGLKPGATIQLVINEAGQPVMVPVEVDTYGRIVTEPDYMDPVINKIYEDGYVKNTALHRRWVMAQMFRMLNYKYRDYRTNRVIHEGYTDYINYVLPHKYQYTMTLEELRVLNKLESRDKETFEERSQFFTKEVVVTMCEDYLVKLKEHVNGSKTRYCKGTPYKTVAGRDIFVEDLTKKLYAPIQRKINAVKRAKNYNELYKAFYGFIRSMVKLPGETKKCKEWVDAYKGSGSYYTCKNLIMFHGCQVLAEERTHGGGTMGHWMSRRESMNELKRKAFEYRGEGWRMHGFMKKLIADNEFDFQARMEEIYADK